MSDTDGWWTVWRKPRQGGDIKQTFQGTYDDAVARYNKIADALRQGAVQLRSPEGKITRQYSAPNLRTRW